jgi:putative phage-type endonuclease
MARLSESELATRNEGLGATDIVELLGLSPYRGHGPMRLYLEKIGEPVEEQDASDDGDAREWGHVQEPVILAWYERKKKVKLLPGGQVRHKLYSNIWASLDSKVPGERIVEAKNVGGGMARHWDVTSDDGIPRYVRAQVLLGQACLGARLTDVVASLAGRPPHVWTVEYDAELAAYMLVAAVDWWNRHVLLRVPPPLDTTSATSEFLRRKWPTHEDDVLVPADDAMDQLATARISAAREEKCAAEKKTLFDRRLLNLIGARAGVQGEGWKMTWKAGKDGKRKQRFTCQEETE